MEFQSPERYARYLATYIASPTKIEALVLLDFTKAPPLRSIADMRYRVERKARRLAEAIGPAISPVAPEPEPERVRDYIIIETRPSNPFVGPFMAANLASSVAHDFGFSVEEMCGERRHKPFVHARAVVVRLLKERGWSYPRISRAIGRGDHSTAINASRKFDSYARQNPLVGESYERHRMLIVQAAVPDEELAA